MGSLFDGIGGFPLAAIHNGVIPLWASEIEPFPIRVTQQRLPGMLHYGDITKLDGAMLPPVDIICGGSPCQDLSVAGARAGLAGERSGLFTEQTRIVKEMRDADRSRGRAGIHIRPDLWYGKMCREPSPAESGRARTSASSWKRSSELSAVPFMSLDLTPGHGNLLGESYWELISPYAGGAWTLNTGVSPRGARESSLSQILQGAPPTKYYLTPRACLGILRRAFERGKALPKKLERALKIQAGLALPDGQITDIDAYHINQRDEGIDLQGVSGALMATSNMQMQTFVTQASENTEGFDGYNGDLTGDVAATLGVNCGMSTGRNGVIAFAANQRDEVRDLHDVAGALNAQPGIKQQTFVAGFSAGAGASAGSIGYHESVAPTLKAGASGNCMPSVLCINDQGGQVMEISENMTGTLRAQEHGHQPLVYENHGIDSRYRQMEEVAPTMSARYGTGGNNVPLVEQEPVICITGNAIDRQPQNGGNGIGYQQDIAYTLTATDHHAVYSRQRVDDFRENDVVSTQSARQCKDAVDLICQKADVHAHLIRRLTPLECERLQGFPDGWTDIPGASDSARYKALGNSVAIPCVDFVMQCLVQAIQMGTYVR